MKKFKSILLTVLLMSALSVAALTFAACDLFGGSGGNNNNNNNNNNNQTPDPMIGTYLISSTAFVAPVYFGGHSGEIIDTDTGTGQTTPSPNGKITIAANADISFYAIGSLVCGFQGGTNSGVGGTVNAINYVAETSVGYRCMKVNATTNQTRLTTINKTFLTDSVYVSCTFTYANDVITLTMRCELASDTAKGWTQTFDFAKEQS